MKYKAPMALGKAIEKAEKTKNWKLLKKLLETYVVIYGRLP